MAARMRQFWASNLDANCTPWVIVVIGDELVGNDVSPMVINVSSERSARPLRQGGRADLSVREVADEAQTSPPERSPTSCLRCLRDLLSEIGKVPRLEKGVVAIEEGRRGGGCGGEDN
ncbi:hypothetical protein Cni_G12902 [Canna indica]|uniref:Uncharacterized protein n=1 Tax=Canna indica TaxID=4628 RepID=A0AAQ3KEB2_9LILI|nr:hypothetical protein Cni_G12902 [Canna indica]